MSSAQGTPKPRHRASTAKYKAALRKAIRKNASEPEIDFLNITAMLDMMTIILVFLLKTMSASSASLPQSKDLTLPTSIIRKPPAQNGVTVIVTKSAILVGESDPIVHFTGGDSLAQSGLDAQYKKGGINSLIISPLSDVLRHAYDNHKRLQGGAKGPGNDAAEAIIIMDGSTPYRLLIEVLATVGDSGFGRYHLMVLTGKSKKKH